MIVDDLLNSVSDFDGLPQREQVKLMSFFYCTENDVNCFSPKEISDEFAKHGLSIPKGINSRVSELTKGRPPVLIKGQNGYSFHRTSKKQLESRFSGNSHTQETSVILRDLLSELTGNEQQSFLEEAICCFEIKSYRAAIIMTWLLTIDVIYEFILKPTNLVIFNNAIQMHGKYKKVTIKQKSDFTEMKESAFIEVFRASKLLNTNIRKILLEKLDTRNSCAHPNSIEVFDYKAIGFIQDLVKNVIKVYQ